MKSANRSLCIAFVPVAIAACAHQSAPAATGVSPARVAGSQLTPDEQVRQALNRLTFGPRPGDAAAVAAMGVEHWIDLQLTPSRIPDDGAEALLARMETQRKQVFELIADHPDPQEFQQRLNQLAAQARANPKLVPVVYSGADSAMLRRAQQTTQQLASQIVTAKLLRSVVSERQL